MPHCPQCKSEYLSGVAHCSECGTPLREDPPPDGPLRPGFPRDTEVVPLCRVSDPAEAEIMQMVLTEAGIACHLQTSGALTAYQARVADGATSDYAILLVTRNRVEEARRVLAAARSGPVQWPQGMEPEE